MKNEFELTIGITSFNRFFYLHSLFLSLEEMDRSRVQFIVVDNCSLEKEIEPFLQDLLDQKQIHLLFLRGKTDERNWVNDEYIAKNIIIENAKSEMILFLQDDLQFITNQKSLLDTVSAFKNSSLLDSPCCEINAVRKTTIESNFGLTSRHYVQESIPVKNNGIKFYHSLNNHFHTMGLFKKKIFDKFGLYPAKWLQSQENWGRSEDWYDNLLKSHMPGAQMNVCTWVPHFAPVWNDPRGGYTFIRGNKRYGHYLKAPMEMYYLKLAEDEYLKMQNSSCPLSFSDVCRPLGWSYLLSPDGDQVKYPQSKVMIEGPISDF